MTPLRPICLSCSHYKNGLTCDAFKRIPQEIIESSFDHRKPHDGDGGIVFDPTDKEGEKYAEGLFGSA